MSSGPLGTRTAIGLGLAIPAALIALVIATALGGKRYDGALLHTQRIEDGEERSPPQTWPRYAIAVSGQRNEITAPPERLVIANTSAVDLACAILPMSRIASVCEQAFTWSAVADEGSPEGLREALRDKPSFRELTAENALRHRPDLVLVSSYNDPGTVAALTAAGSPVVCLPHPTTIAGVFENLRMLAEATGAEESARREIEALQRRLDALTAAASGPGHRALSVLLYSNVSGSGSTQGSGTLVDDAIRAAGHRNAAAEIGLSGFANLTFEEVAEAAPDLIVVSSETDGPEGSSARVILRNSPLAKSLPALRDDRFLVLRPAAFSTTSQEIVRVAERIAEAAGAVDRKD
jgi:iron complex transport system substrate-binding protein